MATYTLDTDSPALAPGDWVTPLASDRTKVTRATARTVLPLFPRAAGDPPFGGTGIILGCVDAAYAPGATSVAVRGPGEVVAAGTFAELGPGGATELTMDAGGRAVRNARVTGGEIRLGTIDTSGNVTVEPQSPPLTTSPRRVFNIVSFGAVADGNIDDAGGKSTDNTAAVDAALAAGAATGVPFVLFCPAGVYNFRGRITVPEVPVEFEGEAADGFETFSYPATQWVFQVPSTVALAAAGSCIHFPHNKSGGSAMRRMQIAHEGQFVYRWWQPRMADDVGNYWIPTNVVRAGRSSWGYHGVIYHGQRAAGPFTLTGPTPTAVPSEWDRGTRFVVNDLIYQCGIHEAAGTPWRYRVSAVPGSTDGGVSAFTDPQAAPFAGRADPFVAGQSYAKGDVVRPTDPKWNGYCYSANNEGTAGAEPDAWPTAVNGKVTTNDVTFTRVGTIWPRSPDLPMTDNGVTWLLDDTSGIFHDPNPGGTGPIDWLVLPPQDLLEIECMIRLENMRLSSAHGRGVYIHGSSPNFVDGASGRRIFIDQCVDGWLERGSDCNANVWEQITANGVAGTYIWADSFLGSTYRNCQTAANGIFDAVSGRFLNGKCGFRADAPNSRNHLEGNYSEENMPSHRIGLANEITANKGGWLLEPGYQYVAGESSSCQINSPRTHFSFAGSRPWTSGLSTFIRELIVPSNAVLSGNPPLRFDGAAHTITREDEGSFLVDAFSVGVPITVSRTASNNGTFTVSAVDASVLTVTSGLANEGPVSNVTITSQAVNGFRYVVTATENSVNAGKDDKVPAFAGVQQPVWPTTLGETITEQSGTSSITYQCLGPDTCQIDVGLVGGAPERALGIQFSDQPSRFSIIDNAPFQGWIGLAWDDRTSGAVMAFRRSDFATWLGMGLPLYTGFGATRRLWAWANGSGELTATSGTVGDLVFNTAGGVGAPAFFARTAATGGGLTGYSCAGKIYTSAVETFEGARQGLGQSLSSPYRESITTIAMGDADQVQTAAQAAHQIIQTTGALTAARTLTLPAVAGQTRDVDNQCTGAFSVRIAPAIGDLSTNGIGNGRCARVYCDGTHWRRLTPDTTP